MAAAHARLNVTALLAAYASNLDGWFKWKCRDVEQVLEFDPTVTSDRYIRPLHPAVTSYCSPPVEQVLEKPLRKHGTDACPVRGCPRLVAKANEKLRGLPKAAISHMVDRAEFWKLPGGTRMSGAS